MNDKPSAGLILLAYSHSLTDGHTFHIIFRIVPSSGDKIKGSPDPVINPSMRDALLMTNLEWVCKIHMHKVFPRQKHDFWYFYVFTYAYKNIFCRAALCVLCSDKLFAV